MASLPNKQFLCNYNARDYVASSNTIPNASGALYNKNITLNGSPDSTHIEDGYLTFNGNSYCRFSESDNPFNRSGSDSLTIVAKATKPSSGSDYITLVSNRKNQTLNWSLGVRNVSLPSTAVGLVKGFMLDASSPYITVTENPVTFSFVVDNGNGVGVNYTDSTTGTSEQWAWTGTSSTSINFFCVDDGGEKYVGDFYWLYISPEALTPAEIQQVIKYNEGVGISVVPDEINFSKWGDEAEITVESETDWTGSTQDSWITLNPSTGESGTTTVTVTASKNESGSRRTGTIGFINEGQDTAEVTVGQNSVGNEVPINNLKLGELRIN